MFVDQAKIKIKAGDGGDGAVSFHREKYVAAGGPDGGDGGKGGDIIFQVDDNFSTLIDFRYQRKYVAQRGENGGARNCTGRSAPDLIIRVPRGTVIRNAATGRIMADLSTDEPKVLAKAVAAERETFTLPPLPVKFHVLQSLASREKNLKSPWNSSCWLMSDL